MIKSLMSERAKLVKVKQILTQGRVDQKEFIGLHTMKFLVDNLQSTLDDLNEAISNLEDKMLQLIKTDEDLAENYNIAISVPGIGQCTAIALLAYTNNFSKFDNAKQLGSYCGVVPFERSSGIFKGKRRVSKKANTNLKVLLTMGARAASHSNSHFGLYYTRKIKEGKKESLVINNIRNKILKTVWACVTNKTKYKYDHVYQPAA